MTGWGVTALRLTLAAVVLAACSSDDPEASTTTRDPTTTSTTTTAPERQASTTTTAFDPATVEGEVEAAYLRSWDVYADAVYDLVLDEDALAEVYTGDLLEVRRAEIRDRSDNERAALVRVEHDYEITITGEASAVIVDSYVNHQVLIDLDTKKPLEPDPNSQITDAFTARRVDGRWLMTDLDRVA